MLMNKPFLREDSYNCILFLSQTRIRSCQLSASNTLVTSVQRVHNREQPEQPAYVLEEDGDDLIDVGETGAHDVDEERTQRQQQEPTARYSMEEASLRR